MSLKKTVAIAAAAGALAAISVPAMALENEFHGSYTFNTIFSNFQNGASANFNPAANGYGENRKTNNYFEQRARLQYIAKASDDLKLVTHFEIDHTFGQTKAVGTPGVNLDTDTVNIEVKHVYLDFNLGKSFNAKTGLLPYKDTLKGVFLDADLPAIMTTTKLGAYTLGLGYSRFADDNATGNLNRLGNNNKDLFIMDNTFAFTKDTKATLSYYFLADYAAAAGGVVNSDVLTGHTADQDVLLHTFGLSGETKIGALGLSGFAAMQTGHQKAFNAAGSRQFHGWAANVAAKMAVGPGTAKTAFLFTSGNNSTDANHYKGWVSTGVNSWNEGGLMILARNTANSPTSTDNYLRKSITNLAAATIGYDAKLTEKLYLNGNVGFGWAPASASATLNPKNNASDFLGTEINLETGYKVYQNLTLRAQAAYMILGGYYKDAARSAAGTALNKDPDNPYTARLLASFAF